MSLNDSQHLATDSDPTPIDSFPAPSPPLSPHLPAATAEEEADPPHKARINWWRELRAILFLVLAVLGFHSLVAKPFYIPSESMMPGLLKGDRLVVSKYPYGWSWVSPTFHILPETSGRLFGRMPERGDVVIVTPPGDDSSDYIKRVIGLPGDTIALRGGHLILNGRLVAQRNVPPAMIPVDENNPCEPGHLDAEGRWTGEFYRDYRVTGADGRVYCRLPIVRETLPGGRSYDTIDEGYYAQSDEYGPITVPEGHVFLMGDNRDHSADSRFSIEDKGLGGPVPWENIGGRAEFITFSLDGSSEYWNPISWFTAFRGGRAGTSLHPDRAPDPAG